MSKKSSWRGGLVVPLLGRSRSYEKKIPSPPLSHVDGEIDEILVTFKIKKIKLVLGTPTILFGNCCQGGMPTGWVSHIVT